ncbi:Probable magnesium transporter NIPA9 [Linum perenne]
MWESIILTLAATAGNNIGKVLQKKGTIILPPLSFKLKVIRAYALNKAWVIGFLMDIGGAMLMLKAISQAPVSVIQPVSGCGLAVLSVFSHFYLKEVMNVIDWVGITLAAIGTIGVGAGGEEQESSPVSVFQLPWLAVVVALLFVGRAKWMASGLQAAAKRTRYCRWNMKWLRKSYTVWNQAFYLGKMSCCRISSVISKMGFVFLEQGLSKMLVPVCISISVCCSGIGFYYQTTGLKHGRAIVVSTCAAVASIVTGVLAGMLALGERLPSAPAARISLLLGWLLIVVGLLLLVSSTRLLRHLPRSVRRFIKTGVDRNFTPSRSTSMRGKDSNPSAVIQAATLHHLISSSAPKQKN